MRRMWMGLVLVLVGCNGGREPADRTGEVPAIDAAPGAATPGATAPATTGPGLPAGEQGAAGTYGPAGGVLVDTLPETGVPPGAP